MSTNELIDNDVDFLECPTPLKPTELIINKARWRNVMDNNGCNNNNCNGVYAKQEIAGQRSIDTAFNVINDNINALKDEMNTSAIQSDVRSVSNNVSDYTSHVAKDIADLGIDNTKSFYDASIATQAGFNSLNAQLTGLGYSVSDKSALIMQELCRCCGDTKTALTLLQMQLSKEIQDTASEERLANLDRFHDITTQNTAIANAQQIQATANQNALVTLLTANQNALLNKMNESELAHAQERVSQLTAEVTRMNDNANTERIICAVNSSCNNGRRNNNGCIDDINFYNNDTNTNINRNRANS